MRHHWTHCQYLTKVSSCSHPEPNRRSPHPDTDCSRPVGACTFEVLHAITQASCEHLLPPFSISLLLSFLLVLPFTCGPSLHSLSSMQKL